MAKKKKTINKGLITKTVEPKVESVVVQELNVMSADRTTKDIGTFKNALQSAESVHYPNRTLLYDLYDHITLDGHLTGIMEKRVEEVLNKNLYFKDKAGKRVEALDDVIESEAFREIVTKIMEALSHGVSALDFIPGEEIAFEEIPRKHIKPHKQIIAYEQNGEEGIPYDKSSTIWVIGKKKNLGYLLKCAPYAIWKSGNMADWAQYIEIFGQPVRIIYYDAYDTKTKIELRKVLDETGSSLAMMVPKQAQFEMKDGKGTANANGELQEKFKIACDNEMSVVVLGNTETTTSSKSSGYAQSKEHGKQQIQKTKSDLKYVRNMLNSKHFLRILKSYGLPVEGGKFTFEKEIDLGELESRLKIDVEVSGKVPVADDYWYETYGIPKPDNYDELKAKMEEEKKANILPEEEPPTPPAKGKPKPAKPAQKPPVKKKLSASEFLFHFRATLADFFDPAP